jgi:hypothetical protein
VIRRVAYMSKLLLMGGLEKLVGCIHGTAFLEGK